VDAAIVAPMYVNAYIEHVSQTLISGFRSPFADRFPKIFDAKYLNWMMRGMGLLIGDIVLRGTRPDIIHEIYFFPYRLGERRARRVLTIYDMIHEKFASDFQLSEKTAQFKALAANRADHVICISEATRKDAIDVASTRIVVCEYNSLWGSELSVTTPYDETFARTRAHHSNLYFGASITALTNLATTKGYSLVGSNMVGNTLFFVRDDLLGDLVVVAPREAWVKSRFRESRDSLGALTFLPFDERLALPGELPLVNLEDGHQYAISELYGAG
jgi:hypothetical protein